MRWNIKRTKLLLALIPIMSIIFYVLTANNNIYADQSFVEFDIYQLVSAHNPPREGKNSPADYSAAENFAIAAEVYLNAEEVESTTQGTVTAMGFYKQTVLNYHAKTGGHIFSESVSLSAIASVAEQRYFKDKALLYREGSASGSAVKSWSDTIVELTPAVYRQRYGVVPQEITKYSVTEDSVLSGSLVSENADGTYTYELILDAAKAQKFSRYEMMTFAGVTAYPDYLSCRLVYTIDDTWHVREVKSYDTYKIDLMGGTKCDSALTETFRFGNVTMPERAQPFIDYVVTGVSGDVTGKKGPADYLSEGYGDYITGARPLCLSASVKLENETLAVKGQVDIGNSDFRFVVNDALFAVYQGDTVYVAAGDNKLALALADLSAFGVSGGGFELGDDILATLFAQYELTETDTHVHIRMPFDLMGMHLDVDMGLRKDEEGHVTADTIDAQIDIGAHTVNITVQIEDAVQLPAFDKAEYRSLSPLLGAVAGTMQADAYRLDGSVTADVNGTAIPVQLSADIFKTEKGADVRGSVTAAGVTADLAYANDTLFLRAGNIGLKAQTADLPVLMQTVTELFGDALPSVDTAEALQTVLPQLLPRDLNVAALLGMLQDIAYRDNTLSLTLRPAVGAPWSVTVTHDEQSLTALTLRDLRIEGIGVQADLRLSTPAADKVTVNADEYIDAKAIANFLPTVKELLTAQSYDLTLGGSVTMDDGKNSQKTFPLAADVIINRAPLALSASVSVADIPVSVVLSDNTVYVTAGKFAAKLALADLQTIAAGNNMPDSARAALALVQKLLPEGGNINDLLQAVTLTEKDGVLTVGFSQNDITASVQLQKNDAGIDAHLQLGAQAFSADLSVSAVGHAESASIAPESRDYLDLSDLVPFVAPITATAQSRIFNVTVSGNIQTDKLNETFGLTATVDLTSGLAARGTLTAAGLSVNFTLLDGTVYVRVGNLALRLPLSEVKTLPAQLRTLLENAGTFAGSLSGIVDTQKAVAAIQKVTELLDKATQLLDKKPDTSDIPALLGKLDFILPSLDYNGITDLLGGISVTGNTLTLSVTPQNGAPYSIALTTDESHITEVALNGLTVKGITANAAVTLAYPAQANIAAEGDYIGLQTLTALLPAVNTLLTAQSYDLTVGGSVTADDGKNSQKTFPLSANVTINRAPLALSACVTVADIPATVVLADNMIYITAGKFAAKLALADLQTIAADNNMPDSTRAALALVQKLLPQGGDINDLLQAVTLTEKDGVLTVEFSQNDITASVQLQTIDAGINANLQLGASAFSADFSVSAVGNKEPAAIAPENRDYLDLSDLVPFVAPVTATVQSRIFNVTVSGNIAKGNLTEPFDLTATVDLTSGIAAQGTLTAAGLSVNFTLLDGTVYVRVGNLALKLPLAEIKELPAQLRTLLENAGTFAGSLSGIVNTQKAVTAIQKVTELLDKATQTITNKPDTSDIPALLGKLDFILPSLDYNGITELLGGISVAGNTLTLCITPQNGAPYSIALTTDESHITSVALSHLTVKGITANAAVTLAYPAQANIAAEGDYIGLQTLTALLPAVNRLLTAQTYQAELLDGQISGRIADKTITATVGGKAYLSLAPLAAYADFAVRGCSLQAFYTNNRIYLTAGGLKATATVDELQTLINEITSLLGNKTTDDNENKNDGNDGTQSGAPATLLESLLKGVSLPELLAHIEALQENADGSIAVQIAWGELTLSARLAANGDASLTLHDLSVAYGGKATVCGTLTLSTAASLPMEEPESINGYLSLGTLTPFVRPLYTAIQSDSLVLNLHTGRIENTDFAEDFKMQVRLKKTTTNGKTTFAADGGIELSGTEIEFVLQAGTVYVTVGDLAFAAPVSDLRSLLPQLTTLLDNAGVFADNLSPLLKKDVADKLITLIGKAGDLLDKADTLLADPGAQTDIKTVLDLLGKLDFMLPTLNYEGITGLLGGITVQGDDITLTVSPAKGDAYTLSLGLRKNEETQNTVFELGLHGLTLFGYTLSADATLTYGDEFAVAAPAKYVRLQTLVDLLPALNRLLTADAFELKLTEGGEIVNADGTTEKIFGKINTSFLSGQISGSVQFTLSPFTLHADLMFDSHEIDVRYAGDTAYLRINGMMVRFTVADVKDFAAQIKSYTASTAGSGDEQLQMLGLALGETVEKASLIEHYLRGKTIAELLTAVESLSEEDGKLCLTLRAGDFTGNIRIAPSADGVRAEIPEFAYGKIVYNSSAYAVLAPFSFGENADETDPLGITPDAAEAAKYVRLSDLQTYVAPVMNMLNETHIRLTFGGDVYAGGKDDTAAAGTLAANQTHIEGELKIARTDGFADLYAKILLSGKTGNHSIEVYVLDGTVYRDENGALLPDAPFDVNRLSAYLVYNGLYASINYRSAMCMVGALRDILNLNAPMLDDLLQKAQYEKLDTTVFETMEIAGLDGLRDTLQTLLGTAEDVSGVAQGGSAMSLLGMLSDSGVNKALQGVSLYFDPESELLHLYIDNAIFPNKTELPQDAKPAEIVLGHNGKLPTYLSINDLIVNDDHVTFTADITCGREGFTAVTAPVPPSGTPMSDFSTLGDLLTGVIKTGGLREFHIAGTANLKIIGIFGVDVPMTATVKILDDGSTVAAVGLNVPKFGIKLGKLDYSLEQSVSNIYYANDRLYFIIDVYSGGKYSYTETYAPTVKEFLSDITFYLFKAVRLSQSIQDMITSSGSISVDLQNILAHPNEVLKEFSRTDNTYKFLLGLKRLLGSNDFADLTMKLGTSANGYINSLYANTTIVSVVELTLNATLDNLTYDGQNVTGAHKLDPAYTTGNGTYPYRVTYGQSSDITALRLGGDITRLEDDLAFIFPSEGLQSFNALAKEHRDRAAQKSAQAERTLTDISDRKLSLQAAQQELADAKRQLASIPQGTYGYARAQTRVELAQKQAERAQADLTDTQEKYAELLREAAEETKTAELYEKKAAELYDKRAAKIAAHSIELIDAAYRQLEAHVDSVRSKIESEATSNPGIYETIVSCAETMTGYVNDLSKPIPELIQLFDTIDELLQLPYATEEARAAMQTLKQSIDGFASVLNSVNSALDTARNKSASLKDKASGLWIADRRNKAIQKAEGIVTAADKIPAEFATLQATLRQFTELYNSLYAA